MSSNFPKAWKIARVVPVPKKKQATVVKDFRPISILSFLSKVLEKLISTQMKLYLEQNKLLCEWQSGFRSRHSTTTAVLKISEDIREGIDNERITFLTLLDFTKAFDTVNHRLLILKLKDYYGFSEEAATFFNSYLCDRFQRVDVNGELSSLCPIFSGVPQGSINGPILFSMFINDIYRVLKYCRFHMYADDVQLYIQTRLGLVEDAVSRLNEDLRAVFSWSVKNQLILNSSKCYSIVISRENLDTSTFPLVTIGSSVIPYVDTIKNLGIIMNKVFDWSDHVNLVVRKIYAGLRRLWATADFTPRSTKMRLVQALLIPIITFGDVIYAGLDYSSLHKLSVAFNSCVRYVFNLRRYDHVSQYSRQILGMSLESYLKYRTCLQIDKLLRFHIPRYLYENIQCMSSSGRSGNLLIPRHKFLVTGRSFFIRGIKIYNEIPLHIKRSCSASGFRRMLFNHFSQM